MSVCAGWEKEKKEREGIEGDEGKREKIRIRKETVIDLLRLSWRLARDGVNFLVSLFTL